MSREEEDRVAFLAACEVERLRAVRRWPDTRSQIDARRRAAAAAADPRPREDDR